MPRVGRHEVDGDRSREDWLLPAGFPSEWPPWVTSHTTWGSAEGGAVGLAPDWEAQMEIFGAGGTQGPQPIYPRLAAFSLDAGQTVHAGSPRDHVEISPLGQMLDGIGQLPEIRQEKVDEIRRQMSAGSYESSEKLEVALDRLLDELLGW
jgi:negative regulator of flagellin synthesis FlgM